MFIDKYEIEEMLGQFYDFGSVTEHQWEKINNAVLAECKRRGLLDEAGLLDDIDYDTYSAICDGCVGRVLSENAL